MSCFLSPPPLAGPSPCSRSSFGLKERSSEPSGRDFLNQADIPELYLKKGLGGEEGHCNAEVDNSECQPAASYHRFQYPKCVHTIMASNIRSVL